MDSGEEERVPRGCGLDQGHCARHWSLLHLLPGTNRVKKREYMEGVNWTKGTVLGTEAYSTCYQVQIGLKREYREGVD
jgi:hypothetical protein